MEQKANKSFSRKSYLLLFMLLLAGIVFATKENKKDPMSEVAPVITYSSETPDEVVPEQSGYAWKGTSNDPKRIVIPKINIDTFLQNVGVDQNNQIAVPTNIHIAGWFVDSVKPGDAGLSIIDGHVNGVSSDEGVFRRLKELVVGDSVQIVMGDNLSIDFKVVSNQEIATAESASVLYSQNPTIKSQLNLITCTGNFDRANRQYNKRQITTLERI